MRNTSRRFPLKGDVARPYLTKQPRTVKKEKFTCIGGPFDGDKISLTVDGPYVHSAIFSTSSFNNDELGRYVSSSEHAGSVEWQKYEIR